MAEGASSKANKIAVIVLVVMAAGIAALMMVVRGSKTSGARVYFDNGLDVAVKASVDDKETVTIPAHSAKADDLPVGKHTVKITDDQARAVETVDIAIPSAEGITRHRFVYNVAKKSKYQTTSIGYGSTAKPDSKLAPIGDGQQFFELPGTDSDFLPVDVVSEKGKAGTVIALIFHSPLHKTWPCCANACQLLEKDKKSDKTP